MKIFNASFSITLLIFHLAAFGLIGLLLFLPLTNIIGYEFSAVTAIIFFLLFGLISIHKQRLGKDFKFVSLHSMMVLIIPFLASVLNTIFNSICPLSDSLFFYFIISVPAGYLGLVAGRFSFALAKRFSYIVFVFIFLLLVIEPVLGIYFYPQIYFYNPIITFFPGTIYDELIEINGKMILYRSIILIIGILTHYIIVIAAAPKKKNYLMLPFLLTLIIILLKPHFGFATSHDSLKNTLNRDAVTEYYTISYNDSIKQQNLNRIILDHVYCFKEIHEILGIKPGQKIRSFVFENREQKGRLFGAENADVAKPWLHEIYIEEQTSGSTIKHELVHAFSGEFGTTPFKVAEDFNFAVIEGLAMAVENEYAGYNPHYLAYIAAQSDFKISLQSIFSGFNFFGNVSSLSYVYSGSFFKYLGDKYGYKKLVELYTDIDFEKYFDKSLAELEENYYKFLNSLNYSYNQSTAELFFGRKPLIKKYCAREAARELAEADKLFSEGKYSESEKIYNRVYKYSASYQALRGLIYSKVYLDNLISADTLLKNEINNFKGSSFYFNLEIIAGDLKVRLNDSLAAVTYYDSVMTQNPSYGYYSAASVRKEILNFSTNDLLEYLKGNSELRLEKLRHINNEKIFYESFPALLDYSVVEEVHPDSVIANYHHSFEVTDLPSAMAAKEFSEYLRYYGYYNEAIALAEKSLQYCDNMYNEVWEENLEKTIWFSKFASDILEKVKYIEHN